jgi:hypothetical protein
VQAGQDTHINNNNIKKRPEKEVSGGHGKGMWF